MRTSEWFSTVDDDGVFVHFLISVAPHIPAEHGDTKMAELLGHLDPFVLAGEDVLIELNRRDEKKKVG
jgi:hypothetical protein